MHPSAMSNCKLFYDVYVRDIKGKTVVEIGSQDVNGSIRSIFPPETDYIGVDFAHGPGVDVVLVDAYRFPLADESADFVVSSSCFEHSEFFWVSFLEVMRILKPNGLFYLNAPSNGYFHRYPVDCWRFYPDSGKALEKWARHNKLNSILLESYLAPKDDDVWNDFVAVFLKDQAHVDQYNDFIVDRLEKFTNGRTYNRGFFVNYDSTLDDQKLINRTGAALRHFAARVSNDSFVLPPIADIPDPEGIETFLGTAAEGYAQFGSQADSLRRQVEDLARDRTELGRRLDDLGKQCAAQELERETHYRELKALRDQFAAVESERRGLEDQVESLHQQHEVLEKERRRLEAEKEQEVGDLRSQQEAFAQEQETFRRELETLTADRDAWAERFDALTRSTAWRLTGPARQFAQGLPAPIKRLSRRAAKAMFWAVTPHRTAARLRFLRFRDQLISASGPPLEIQAVEVFDTPAPVIEIGAALPVQRTGETVKRILYISGDTKSPSHVYRVDNMVRGLNGLGYATEVVGLHELWRVIDRIREFDAVIFWRIATGPDFYWSADVDRILDEAKRAGIPTFFDVDDLVFDPSVCNETYVDGLRYLTAEERAQYDRGVLGYQQLMVKCGRALVTTNALKTRAERFGVEAHVVPNGFDLAYETAAGFPSPPRNRSAVVIGYTPGTKTHQKDFAIAAEALAELLREEPKARLHILGPLQLEEFPALEGLLNRRVFLDPSVGRDRVFHFNQQIDINIAPLELDNPFTASKSELKYFEAAAFGVPTVAARVGPYVHCIDNGENGFAVETKDEWLQALRLLVKDPKARRRIGLEAHRRASLCYNAQTVASVLHHALEHSLGHSEGAWPVLVNGFPTGNTVPEAVFGPKAPAVVKAVGRRMTVLMPSAMTASGGHRTAINVARAMVERGFELNILMEAAGAGLPPMEEYLAGTRARIDIGWHRSVPSDLVMATVARSAAPAADYPAHRHSYLVQDFEASFNALGDGYVEAENSYAMGLKHITIGNWLTRYIADVYGAPARPAGLGVDVDLYAPTHMAGRERALCFLYQPEKSRRAPILGIQALRKFKRAMPDVKIYLYGSDQRIDLDFDFENLGLIRNLPEIAQLYHHCTAGLCISLSNPSRIPFEMMAAGCVPVDLYRYNNLFDHPSGAGMLAHQSPEALAEALTRLFSDDQATLARRERCMALGRERTLKWEGEVAGDSLNQLVNTGRFEPVEVTPTYFDDPILGDGAGTATMRFCQWQMALANDRSAQVPRKKASA